jgi:phage tail-like protein
MPAIATARTDELTVSRFCVELEGLLVATFTECSGLSGQIEVETYQEGGLNSFEHKLPGRASFGNVTLSTGIASASDLWTWFYNVSMGTVARKNVSIVMFNQMYEETMRWNLEAAYPVSWTGPSFTAGDANIAVQSLELAHHGITLSAS